MHKYFSFFLCIWLLVVHFSSAQPSRILPYKNPQLSTQERVKDLLARMTLAEKVAQMQCIWSSGKRQLFDDNGHLDEAKASQNFPNGLGQVGRPNEGFGEEYVTSKNLNPRETAERVNRIQHFFLEKTRLGIPVMFHEESLHGNQAIGATSFPSHLALGCTWDEDLLTEVYTAVAEEVRVRGGNQVLAPVVDLGRDPRWGRTEETLGEDPYHVSRLALREVKAYQGSGEKIGKKNVVATLKHLGVHGAPESGSNPGPSYVDERTLREIYLPSFKACVQEGKVGSIMPCYNELSGIPAHTNRWLLNDLVRKEWGFKGYYTSDYYGIGELITVHKMAKDSVEAALLAFHAGVDLETPNRYAYNALPTLVKQGKVLENQIDEMVNRLLTTKFNLGLFDDPYTDPELAEKIIGSDKNRAIALKAAQEAMVLLKNTDQLLPLDTKKYKKIAVIGPNADRCILGGYSSEPKQKITPWQGLKAKAQGKCELLYSEGCRISDKGDWFSDSVTLSSPAENRKRIAEAVAMAQKADVILLFVGGNETTSREGWSSQHMGDLSNLELIGEQNELVSALHALHKPMAAFVMSGPPLAFRHLDSSVQALVNCFYLGQETGNAVADLIYGTTCPSGKLSISIPRSAGHLPCFYNYKPSARRGYLFDRIDPLYSFGQGLSYTTFAYGQPRLSAAKIKQGQPVILTVDVTNTGLRAGTEVVQVYIRDAFSSVTRPVKELKDFARIPLQAGEKKTVTFTITPDKLSFYNREMNYVVEPGTFEVMVGTSSVENQKLVFEVEE